MNGMASRAASARPSVVLPEPDVPMTEKRRCCGMAFSIPVIPGRCAAPNPESSPRLKCPKSLDSGFALARAPE